jgi:hypothetical protein
LKATTKATGSIIGDSRKGQTALHAVGRSKWNGICAGDRKGWQWGVSTVLGRIYSS